MNTEEWIDLIKNTLQEIVPAGFNCYVNRYASLYTEKVTISIGPGKYTINNVPGQYPAMISLWLDMSTLKLEPQVFGGNGGQRFYVASTREFYCYDSITIRFVKNVPTTDGVIRSLTMFVKTYPKLLRENVDRLPHKDLYNSEALDYLKKGIV